MEVELIPDSSFYTSKLPYLETEQGPVSDWTSIFLAIMPMPDNVKDRIAKQALIDETLHQLEKIVLFVLYDEQYTKTRKIHSTLNKWPWAYYPPIWMKRYTERKCIDMILPQEEENVPIIHQSQERQRQNKQLMDDAKKSMKVDSLLSSLGEDELSALFVNCIERYRRI